MCHSLVDRELQKYSKENDYILIIRYQMAINAKLGLSPQESFPICVVMFIKYYSIFSGHIRVYITTVVFMIITGQLIKYNSCILPYGAKGLNGYC